MRSVEEIEREAKQAHPDYNPRYGITNAEYDAAKYAEAKRYEDTSARAEYREYAPPPNRKQRRRAEAIGRHAPSTHKA